MGHGTFLQRRLTRRVLHACALAVAVAVAFTAPAAAQVSETARTSAQIAASITALNTADMDFGKIAYSATAGTVVVSAGSAATCLTTGSLVRTGTCRAAKFEGSVRFLFGLQVTRPAGSSIDLTGPGGATMRLDSFTYGAGPGIFDLGQSGVNHHFLIFNLTGAYSFYMGGTLHVGADQTPGVYNGTFVIELNYD